MTMARLCTEILLDTAPAKIPLLLPTLDAAFSGGVPAGEGLVEVSGGPGSGKTCLMLQLCASYFVSPRLPDAFSRTPVAQALERAARRAQEATLRERDESRDALGMTSNRPENPPPREGDGLVVYVDCDGGFTASRFLEIAQGALRTTHGNFSGGSKDEGSVETPLDMLSRVAVLRVFSSRELFSVMHSLLAYFAPGALADEGSRFNINAKSLAEMVAEPLSTKQEMPPPAVSAFFASMSAFERPQLGLIVVDSLGSLFHPSFFPSPFDAQKALLKAGGTLLRLVSASGAAGVVTNKTTPVRLDGKWLLWNSFRT